MYEGSIINAILSVFENDDRFSIYQNKIVLTINNVTNRKLKRQIYACFNRRGLFYIINPPYPPITLKIIDVSLTLVLENNQFVYLNFVIQDILQVLYLCYKIQTSNNDQEKYNYQTILQGFLMNKPNNEWYQTGNDTYDILYQKIKSFQWIFTFDRNIPYEYVRQNIESDEFLFNNLLSTHVSWDQIQNFFNILHNYSEDEARLNLMIDLDLNQEDPVVQNINLDDDFNFDPYRYLETFDYDALENDFYRIQNDNNRYDNSEFDDDYFVDDDNEIFYGNYIKYNFNKNK